MRICTACVFLVYAHAYFSCIYAHDTPPRVQHFSASHYHSCTTVSSYLGVYRKKKKFLGALQPGLLTNKYTGKGILLEVQPCGKYRNRDETAQQPRAAC